jgi:hypothetical protein
MKFTFKPIFAFLLVLPLVIWLYNPYELYFLNDDSIYIPKNQNFFSTDHLTSRVLTEFTLQIDVWLYGENAWGYHLTNLLLHVVCTGLVYVLVKKCALFFEFVKPDNLAALGSFLFFIYAFHSEAVLWIIGRGGSLSTIFAVLSLIFFFDRSKGKFYYLFSLVFFALGLLTYESIWILPVLVSLLIFLNAKQNVPKSEWFLALGFWVVFFVFLLCRQFIEGTFSGTPYGNKGTISLSDLARYVYNFITLFLRSFIPPSGTAVFMASAAVFALGLMVLLWFLNKRRLFSRFRLFSYVSFLVCLLPYLMFGIDTHDTESERFLYLPSVFVCLIIADFVLLIHYRKLRVFILVFLALFHLFFLYRSSAAFKQSSRIAKTTIETLEETNASFDTIYLIDVPTQYGGAFIFRIGFQYIFNWLLPQVKYNQQTQISNYEMIYPKPAYSGVIVSRESSSILPVTVWEKIRVVNKKPNDLVLLWTDTTFWVIK